MSDDLLMEMDPGNHAGEGTSPYDAAPTLDEASVFLAVVDDGPQLAFCAYNETSDTLSIMATRSNGFDASSVVTSVLAAVQPTLLLLPPRIVGNATLLQVLTSSSSAYSSSASSSSPYRLLKSSSLEVSKCRQIVLKLRVKAMMRDSRQQQQQHFHHVHTPAPRHFPLLESSNSNHPAFTVSHYHALASIIDFDCKTLLQAMGSLLSFLQGTVLLGTHQDPDTIFISHLQQLPLNVFVQVPRRTLYDLHIFRTDFHPLALQRASSSSSKEGFSLYSLLDRTRSSQGRLRLSEWMHQPLRNVQDIYLRQAGILWGIQNYTETSSVIMDHLKHLKAVAPILTRLQKNSRAPTDVVSLCQSLQYAVAICEMLEVAAWRLQQVQQQQDGHDGSFETPYRTNLDNQASRHNESTEFDPDEPPTTRHFLFFLESLLKRCHTKTIKTIVDRIVNTVNLDETLETKSFSVLKGFDADLDSKTEDYANLGEIMRQASQNILASRQQQGLPYHASLSVVFFPQVGFLVAVVCPNDGDDDGNDASPDTTMKFVFRDEQSDYYKCDITDQMDAEIGDLDIAIKNIEFMIASQLEDDILACDLELRETYSALADLDCILAFAEISKEQNYVRPVMVAAEEQCILIESGGHPLQEHFSAAGRFVRNHTEMDESFRVHIVSGPNFSGKSCYARQVGILTYMAHLGCFLPCSSARISVVDRIVTQFSGVETCMVPQSSFQLDLTNMGGILQTATQQSLVLLDEFGKGTSPASGIALLAACLEGLSRVGSMVVCTTHFLEVFSVGLIADGESGVKALQMAVTLPEDDDDVAMPLFELKHGLSTSSAGLACAKMSGVKDSVITRAYEIVGAIRAGRSIQPLNEILFREPQLESHCKQSLCEFIDTDWNSASVDELMAVMGV